MRTIRLAIWTMFCLALISTASWAQQDGTINGKVNDSSGAILPGVGITITSPQLLGGERTLVTDEQGNYRAGLLPPGVYSVKYELPGFKTLVRQDIQASAGFTATLNVVMEVATVAETVTVQGDSPIVDVQSASVATNFNPMAIVFSGFRRPKCIGFYYAFRDWKHGNEKALKDAEKQLFAYLGEVRRQSA